MKVIRVLIYEGPRTWVEATMEINVVKGQHQFGSGRGQKRRRD